MSDYGDGFTDGFAAGRKLAAEGIESIVARYADQPETMIGLLRDETAWHSAAQVAPVRA